MEPTSPDIDKRDVRRPMNAFLIFCKRHRSIVREKNPDLDNRSVTRILGDLWANLKEDEKSVYTNLAKQYKDAFMKANPDYKWHNPEKTGPGQKPGLGKPTNMKVLKNEVDILHEGSIMPGKLADPSNMGGLSLLLMAGQQKDESDNQHSLSATIPAASAAVDNMNSSILLDTLTSKASGSPPKQSSMLSSVVHKLEMGTSEHTETGATKDTVVADNSNRKAASGEPVWKIDGKLVENQTSRKEIGNTGHFEHMIPSAQLNAGPSTLGRAGEKLEIGAISKGKPISPVQSYMLAAGLPNKPVISPAMTAPKMSHTHRSLLSGTILESHIKGGYSDILRDNSTGTKLTYNLDNQVQVKSEVVLDKPLDNHPPDEKENISKVLMTDVKDSKDNKNEESIVQCEKIVVNEIIDKLYSPETAVKKSIVVKDSESALTDAINAAISNKYDMKPMSQGNYDQDHGNIVSKEGVDNFDEHDGIQHVKDEKSETDLVKKEADLSDKTDESEDLKAREGMKRVRTWSNVSKDSDTHEGDEDAEEFHPRRKSRRRNRGQRYQELINEGIIQPSKERMAALQQNPAVEEGAEEEDFQTIDSYILPETAIRRIRKRTTSESAKDKMVHVDDAKRYKTGDFDLEAQIATLPACSVENMGRKRGFIRQRHNSECMYMRNKHIEDQHHVAPAFDIERTLTMPPHMKLPSPEKATGPVVGSRKRKARKHSITHLLPAPPGIFNNTAKGKTSPPSVQGSNTEGGKADNDSNTGADLDQVPKTEEDEKCKLTEYSHQEEKIVLEMVGDMSVKTADKVSVSNVDKNDNTLKVSSDVAAPETLATSEAATADKKPTVSECDSGDSKNGATKVDSLEVVSDISSLSADGTKAGSLVESGTNPTGEVVEKHKHEPDNTEEVQGTSQNSVKSETGEVTASMSLSCRRLSGVVYEQQPDLAGTKLDSSIHV